MIYGYARVSTKKQSLERQTDKMKREYPTINIVEEKQSGKNFNSREEFKKLIKKVKQGDTIVFDSVSRMSRNAEEGIELYLDLFSKGISLIFFNEPHINTDVYKKATQTKLDETGNEIADVYIKATNKVFEIIARQQIEIAFQQADKEGKDISIRVSEGMNTVQADGKTARQHLSESRTGKRYESEQKKRLKNLIKKSSESFDGTLSNKELIENLQISERTFFNYKKEIAEGI